MIYSTGTIVFSNEHDRGLKKQSSRYSSHIIKQGGLIAEEVSSFADSQLSFNGESTKRFLELDKSFVARMDPVSGQLDRLESSSRMSSASMSSLASNVSRILELVSSNPALAVSEASHDEDEKSKPNVAHASLARTTFEKPKFDPRTLQRPSRTKVEWSCDFLPGIEAAFSASGFSCLYCADEFDQDSAEWFLKARHLVDEHRYGECNLLLAYDSEEKFAKHIQEFHQCSLGHVYHLYNELLDKHCRFGREMGFHRGQESNDQNLTDDFHSIRSRRWEALFDNHRGLKAMSDHSRGAKFVLHPELAQETQPVQRPWDMGFYNAISEEGCIIDGLMVASIFHPWSIFNPYGNNIKKPCYSLGDGIKVSRYEFDDRCDSLFEATRLLHTHDANEKPGLGKDESRGKPSASFIVPEGSLDTAKVTNQRDQINSWLLEILKNSTTTRIIVFRTMTHCVNYSDMDTWLEKVLEFWETDEAATKLDEPDNLSDGAVDSRGSPEARSVTNHEDTEPLGLSEGWRPYHASSTL